MTLTNRLLAFFLAALALVLAAFSGAIYALADVHLHAQLNVRATATLDALVAASELEADGLEWEAKNRKLTFREESPRWELFGDDGARVDGSEASPALADYAVPGADGEQVHDDASRGGEPWRIMRRTLRFANPEAVRSSEAAKRYRTFVFVTAWPLTPIHRDLRQLALTLGGVSLGVWLIAALLGRWFVRRALSPVRDMAEAAKAITADDLAVRLPVPTPPDELRDLATAFNETLTRVQDSFERQRRFTGEASHQLRTPLTAMLGQMEVALRHDRDPGEYRRVLESSIDQAGRLRNLIETLLFLARADAEAALPDLEDVNLSRWLPKHLTETWATHPRFRDIRIEMRGHDGTVRAQPALLGQAFDNLVDNALKYGAANCTVDVRLTEAAIEVIDRGPGIAAADLPHVFEPFFRSADARQRGIAGVGLGLAVTARIIAAFGGQVTAESSNGLTCFAIQLNAIAPHGSTLQRPA
jgi:heavy metal sensor kinase